MGTQPADEPFHVMADLPIGSFEDNGYPPLIAGKLCEVPARLIKDVQAGGAVRVELGGQTYRFDVLHADGTFRLTKDSSALTF